MKKVLIVSLFTLMTVMAAQAQKGFHGGVFVLPQTTWMFNSADSDDGNFAYQTTFRVAFGLHTKYNFTDNVGVGIDLMFSPQGQKFGDDEDDPTFDAFRKVNYLKIPLLFHFNSSADATVMGRVYFGPQVGILTAAKLEVEDNILGTSNDVDLKDEDAYNSANVGAVFGFGIGINATDYLAINFGLRFDALFNAENLDETRNSPYFTGTDGDGEPRENTTQVTGGIELGIVYVLRTR